MSEFLNVINPFIVWGGFVTCYFVAKHTRSKGRMGLNLEGIVDPPCCLNCGIRLPRVRIPNGLDEVLWGGWTCPGCKSRFDKWGRPRTPR